MECWICARQRLLSRSARQVILPISSTRGFTSSNTWQNRAIPEFQPSVSPALDEFLQRLRRDLFLPAYLNTAQQLLVYRKKYRQQLEVNPPVVQFGNEEHTLRPLDPMKDIPRRWDSFSEALNLMVQNNDYKNAPILLENFHGLGMRVKQGWYEKMARHLVMAGQIQLLMNTIHQVKHNGLSLKYTGVRHETLWGIRKMAIESNWDLEATDGALRYAKYIIEDLALEEHQSKAPGPEGNPISSLFVTATALEIAAARAIKHQDEKDTDGQVALFAKRLMSIWTTQPTKDAEAFDQDRKRLVHRVGLLQSLEMANQVLGTAMPNKSEAESKVRQLEEDVQKGIKEAKASIDAGSDSSYFARALTAWDARIK